MKQYRSYSVLVATSSKNNFVQSEECKVEHNITAETMVDFAITPMNPLCRARRKQPKREVLVIYVYEGLKAA